MKTKRLELLLLGKDIQFAYRKMKEHAYALESKLNQKLIETNIPTDSRVKKDHEKILDKLDLKDSLMGALHMGAANVAAAFGLKSLQYQKMKEAIDRQSEPCMWWRDEPDDELDSWVADCGYDFYINDGASPTEIKFKYCPGCGRTLKERK